MGSNSSLVNRVILLVDDEPDILESVTEELEACLVHRAADFETAQKYLLTYVYDAVILDIMGVNGFELLKISVVKNFPTIILTAHALTPEALKKSIKLGALSFLPKEKISELYIFLEDIIQKNDKSVWLKFFNRMAAYFERKFGLNWRTKDKFFREFEEELKKSFTS